jgi:hypothetical protein
MSVPQDKLMDLMKKGQKTDTTSPTPATPATPGTSTPEAPPMAAPMSTPEKQMGTREAAMINISIALDLLDQSLPAVGAESDEGKAIMEASRKLGGLLGGKRNETGELQQSEILQMLQTLPKAGGMTPESRAIQSAPPPGMTPPGAGAPKPPGLG